MTLEPLSETLVDGLSEARDGQAAPQITALAQHVKDCFARSQEQKQAKSIDTILTACLMQRNGEYTAEEKARFGGVDIYRNVTGTVVRTAIALIHDTYFSAEEKPFTIEATPIPDLPEVIQKAVEIAIRDIATTAAQSGSKIDLAKAQQQLRETALEIAQEEVAKKSNAMERLIEDQLAEGGWRDSFAQVINDVCTFPIGVLKGPIVKNIKQAKWDGNTLVSTMKPLLTVERVSPFDIYPAPDSTTTQDGEYIIERMRMPRAKLADCRELPNFKADAIELLLHERTTEQSAHSQVEDATRAVQEKVSKDFHSIEILDFWGRISGRSILEFFGQETLAHKAELNAGLVQTEWGEIDPFTDYEINVWLAGDYIIRALMNPSPLGTRPYHGASYVQSPGSFWGEGIPQLVRDVQSELNAAARARVYNLGFSSGPITEIDSDQFEEGQRPTEIRPWQIVYSRGSAIGGGKPAIKFYQADSNSAELSSIMQEAYSKAFEITGIPPYMQGFNQGSAQTLGAFSMQYANALKGVKQVIGNFDRGIIEKLIEQFYYFNLFYTDDDTIKADAKVKARGAAGIMAQEQKQARPLETIQKLGPLLQQVSPTALPSLVGEYMKQSGYDPGDYGLPGSTSEQELKFSGKKPVQGKINMQAPPIDGRSGPAVGAMRNSSLPAQF